MSRLIAEVIKPSVQLALTLDGGALLHQEVDDDDGSHDDSDGGSYGNDALHWGTPFCLLLKAGIWTHVRVQYELYLYYNK